MRAQEDVNTTSRALQFLISGFEKADPAHQPAILRQVGLLGSDGAAPFLVNVALQEDHADDVRREALKAMMALPSRERFRPFLVPLAGNSIETGQVLNAVDETSEADFAEPVARTVTRVTDELLRRKAILVFLTLWNGKERVALLSEWKNTNASSLLADIARSSTGQRQLRAIQVMGFVRDSHSFDSLIRFLDTNDPAIGAAAIVGLGKFGTKGAYPLGRFLQKSDQSELRKMAIEQLGKISGNEARRALKIYREKAPKDEKLKIDEVLKPVKRK